MDKGKLALLRDKAAKSFQRSWVDVPMLVTLKATPEAAGLIRDHDFNG